MSQPQDTSKVAEVRKELASTWLDTLSELQKELATIKRSPKKAVSEVFCKKLKICSDQLRIEFRTVEVSGVEPGQKPEEPSPVTQEKPLRGLTVVRDEDAA